MSFAYPTLTTALGICQLVGNDIYCINRYVELQKLSMRWAFLVEAYANIATHLQMG